MDLDDFNITDNGDGTFTLTPKDTGLVLAELKAEYRRIKAEGAALLATRNDINTQLQELVARRDELRDIYVNGGYGDPDADDE